MARLEAVANVVLRVPALALLELLQRGELGALLRGGRAPSLPEPALRGASGLAHALCLVVLALPLQALAQLYGHVLAALLLVAAHLAARDYIQHELDNGFEVAILSDATALARAATTLAGQLCLGALCSRLAPRWRPWALLAPLMPVLGHLVGVPPHALPLLGAFAASLSVLGGLCLLAPHIRAPFQLVAAAGRELREVMQAPQRLVAHVLSLWSGRAIPLLFLVFWLGLFGLRIAAFVTSGTQHSLLLLLLSSAAECCSTPYSLIGLTFTVSYLALGVLNLCKFYLMGFGAFQNGNVMHRGVTEAVTLLLLALQTGLLDLQVPARTFLLSIILFIVVTSTLQSMMDIAEPVLLALAASRNRSPWPQLRGLSLCLFLLVFPSFLALRISRLFPPDLWLLILLSSCALTSLQALGTLFVSALLAVDPVQAEALERVDELIYCVSAVTHVLEFLVAVVVVAFGTWESLFGEWSWVGTSVIIVHSYFNVWLRARSGWRSFLLRRDAAKKIQSLARATGGQLQDHNDVCAICFQDMQVAVVTRCSHIFHASCLRKWLYVQDTCPMCHQQVAPAGTEEDTGSARAAQQTPHGGDEVPGDRGATMSPQHQDGVPSVVPGQGDSGTSQDHRSGHLGLCHPAHPHTSVPQEQEAGTTPAPHGHPHLSAQDPFGSTRVGTRDSKDAHSGHQPS